MGWVLVCDMEEASAEAMVEGTEVMPEIMQVMAEVSAKAGAAVWPERGTEALEWEGVIGAHGIGRECLTGFRIGGNSRNLTNPAFLGRDR